MRKVNLTSFNIALSHNKAINTIRFAHLDAAKRRQLSKRYV